MGVLSMTGAEKIIEKILADARTDVQNTERELEERRAALEAQYEARAQQDGEKILEDARQDAQEGRRRQLSMAQLEGRKAILAVKQELIAQAWEGALQALCALPVEEYRALIGKMLLETATEGEHELLIAQTDAERLGQVFLDEYAEPLAAKGATVRAGGFAPIRGGFILRTGGMEINCALETLMRMARGKYDAQVAEILF